MSIKRALIVDDSKTAQFKLKKILSIYQLTIDSALSAEDALSYLSYQVPDIIFMDHSMKGMNGLEAVKIIKANPVTAVIPVVMYTAQKGDVYMGQARAIGAIDVLSKDIMTESDIRRVMKSVNITPSTKLNTSDRQPVTTEALNTVHKGGAATQESVSQLKEIRDQVSNALEIQHNKIQRDIQDNSRLITKRLMREIRGLQSDLKHQQDKQRDQHSLIPKTEQSERKTLKPFWYFIPILLLLGTTVYSLIELSKLGQQNRSLVGAYKEATLALSKQNKEILNKVKINQAKNRNQLKQQSVELIAALVRAVNTNGKYPFGGQALGNEQFGLLSSLLGFLEQTGFTGTLTIEVHTGNYCVVTGNSGQLSLPAEDATMKNCQLLSYYDNDFSNSAQASLPFINYLNSSSIIEKGDLKVDIKPLGIYAPTHEYPIYAESARSGSWNAVAALNNRMIISLQTQ